MVDSGRVLKAGMNLKSFLKKTFGRDLFGVKDDDLLKERIKVEKGVEKASDEIKGIQEKIQKLLLDSKGQPKTLKLLNVQKIKALRLESNTKQQEASRQLQLLQLIFLVEAMRERQKSKQKSKLVDKVLNTDVEQLNKLLMDMDIMKAFEEGKVDKVKERLAAIFGKEDMPVDMETQDLLKSIEDLERVDEDTAMEKAREKSKEIAEAPLKKREKEEEE